jgi:hypothetical protein
MSVRKAIFDVLKTYGDAQTPVIHVYNFGGRVTNPKKPYFVLKMDAGPIQQDNRGLEQFTVYYNDDPANIDRIEEMIDTELVKLLSGQVLTYTYQLDTITIDIDSTGETTLTAPNDDGTSGRGRVFVLPMMTGA